MFGYLILFGIGAFLLWKASMLAAPLRDCPRCGRRGTIGGVLGGQKLCPRCGGAGLVRRWLR